MELTNPVTWYDRRWRERGDQRAWKNETWAEIERRRHVEGRGTVLFLSEEAGLGLEEARIQSEIWSRLTPDPWWRTARFWWGRNGYTPQRLRIWTIYGRARRGWSIPDTWGFDMYLAKIISEGVAHLRKVAHGHPGNITMDEWLEILDKIVEGFAIKSTQDYVDGKDSARAKLDEALKLFVEYFESLWD